jgi:hypothetical protein
MNELLIIATVTATLLFIWKTTKYGVQRRYVASLEEQLGTSLSGLIIAAKGKAVEGIPSGIGVTRPIDNLEDTRIFCKEVLVVCRQIAEKNGDLD